MTSRKNTEINPFNLMFGVLPKSYISRAEQEERVVTTFLNNSYGSLYLVTGVRGSGKTVFITQVSKKTHGFNRGMIANKNFFKKYHYCTF